MTKPKLTQADFEWAAKRLGVEVAVIKAVDAIESRGRGFLPSGEPVILFERHIFHRLTHGRFSKRHPDISNATPGGYGSEATQHKRLQKATALDRTNGLKSASWGRFQIMGFNHKAAGFDTVQAFVNAMYQSERKQLEAFVRFLETNRLVPYLKAQDWAGFARRYNGPGYKKNAYDTKLRNAFERFVREEKRDQPKPASIAVNSRDLNELEPDTRAKARAFLEKAEEAGFRVLVYSTFRNSVSQDELYANGRTKPGKVVTNARAGQSWHNFRRAFDFVPLTAGGAADWNNTVAYHALGQIGKSVGLEWGGDWKGFVDRPHFQNTGGKTLAQMRVQFGTEAPNE